MKPAGKRGEILVGNIIFIVLNLIFLAILIFFVFSRTGNPAVLEEKYSKQIALMIDAAKPGMIIHLNMEDAIEKAKDYGLENNLISIESNKVFVKLREKGGNSYSFFNDVDVSVFPDTSVQPVKEYVIVINRYK